MFIGRGETFSMAFRMMLERKARAALTLLGVAVGTATVIVVGSILTGMQDRVGKIAESFGPDVLMVSKYDMAGGRFGRPPASERMRKDLTAEDAEALDALPTLVGASPQIVLGGFGPDSSGATIKYHGVEYSRPIVFGVSAKYSSLRAVDIRRGRFFTDAEDQRRARVVVIPAAAVEPLFGSVDPIDKEIELDGTTFRVVGVREKGATGLFGDSTPDDRMFHVPYKTLAGMHPEIEEVSITARARSGQITRAIDDMTELLRRRRGVRASEPNDFSVSKSEAIFSTFNQVLAILALVVIPISGAGLLVGGVGVMNIMLISVTERTREIGVRRAIGARRRDIVIQFLIEAVTLTATGGGIGILVGWVISTVATRLLPSLPSIVPLWAVVLGFVVSVAVGLISGLWPAIKAARLNPIDALRYE